MGTTLDVGGKSTIYFGRVAELLPRLLPAGRVVVITDATIDRLYPDLVRRYEHLIIGYGEASKTLQTAEMLYRRLMELGADRSTFILGIGGGIVTDVAGYVASTYMRGLDFGFVSTTLLGEVDASVGGKNGVNVADYKNMVGTFSHPRFVLVDVAMLRTLPLRELRAGMAEVVKAAMVGDAELFEELERVAGDELYASGERMERIVRAAIEVKRGIVEQDMREGGLRRKLNLGHTVAHALEKCTREYNHGEAVAIGLVEVSRAAVRRGVMRREDAARVRGVLERLGFDLTPSVARHNILREVKMDKKKRDNMLRVVLPETIGSCRVEEMPFDEFERLLNDE
ncbi:MAG: 3-dehydroquinate synthase [Alistipes sp.]|nr:3-dehydroquinate synthase [Alistipes sp.]